jgi:hypothetical protein
MFYDNLHIFFEGRIATGRHAAVFSSPAAVAPAANKRATDPDKWKEHTGLTGAYDDVPGGGFFNYSAEEGSENEDDNVLSVEYFKKLEVKRVEAADPGPSHSAAKPVSSAVKAAPAVTPKSGPARQMREKLAEEMSRYASHRRPRITTDRGYLRLGWQAGGVLRTSTLVYVDDGTAVSVMGHALRQDLQGHAAILRVTKLPNVGAKRPLCIIQPLCGRHRGGPILESHAVPGAAAGNGIHAGYRVFRARRACVNSRI